MRVRLLTSVALVGAALALAAAPSMAQKKHDHGAAGHKHSHPTAAKGGTLEDVGDYHVEMIAKDGKITLLLRDHEANDVVTDGFKASVLVTAGSKRFGPFDLTSVQGKSIEGPAPGIPSGATAILTLTDKDGASTQGRFRLK
jgi:hypothetical protein